MGRPEREFPALLVVWAYLQGIPEKNCILEEGFFRLWGVFLCFLGVFQCRSWMFFWGGFLGVFCFSRVSEKKNRGVNFQGLPHQNGEFPLCFCGRKKTPSCVGVGCADPLRWLCGSAALVVR